MTKLVVEVTTDAKTQGSYYLFALDEVLVGRGFQSDLIVNDPYVSERHLRIFRDAGGIRVQDLSTKNGTYIPKLKQTISESAIASGDEVVIGNTTIRIFSDAHRVRPARTLRQKNRYVVWMRKPVFAWSMVGLFMGWVLLETFLATSTKTPFVKLLPYPIVMLMPVLLWAGAWAFVGRIMRHRMRFSIHLSMICIFVILGGLMEDLSHYVGFYSNSAILQGVFANTMWASLFIVLLYASLNAATNLRHKTKLTVSSTLTLICAAAAVGMLLAYHDYYFTGSIPYSQTVKPPIVGAPFGQSIADFMSKTNRVFTFDTDAD